MSCLTPPADGPRPKPVYRYMYMYLQFKTLRLVEKGDSFKKRLVAFPISTNLLTIGQKRTPVRPIILSNCLKYKLKVTRILPYLKLDEVSLVDNRPSIIAAPQIIKIKINVRWDCDTWHVTCDIWHVTRDTWHAKCDTWRKVNIHSIIQVPSLYGLGVKPN